MFAHACDVGLEGLVSKVRDSRYTSGRGNDWVKKTCAQRETLPIAGFGMKDSRFDALCRPAEGRSPGLCRQGRPWLRRDLGSRAAAAVAAPLRTQSGADCDPHR